MIVHPSNTRCSACVRETPSDGAFQSELSGSRRHQLDFCQQYGAPAYITHHGLCATRYWRMRCATMNPVEPKIERLRARLLLQHSSRRPFNPVAGGQTLLSRITRSEERHLALVY